MEWASLFVPIGASAAGICVTLLLAWRSLAFFRPHLLLKTGWASQRKSKKFTKHTLFFLGHTFDRGYASLYFIITNNSRKTAKNVKIEVDIENRLLMPNEEMQNIIHLSGYPDLLNNPIFRSRTISRMGHFTRIHYHIDSMHPYERFSGSEPLLIERGMKTTAIQDLYGTGFYNIRRMILESKDTIFFSVVAVSVSAEHMRADKAFVNVWFRSNTYKDNYLRDLKWKTKNGFRTATHRGSLEYEYDITRPYREGFWMGGDYYTGTFWSPLDAFFIGSFATSKHEQAEFLAIPPDNEWHTTVAKLSMDKAGVLTFYEPEIVTTMDILVPRRNYYDMPIRIKTFERLLFYNYCTLKLRRLNS